MVFQVGIFRETHDTDIEYIVAAHTPVVRAGAVDSLRIDWNAVSCEADGVPFGTVGDLKSHGFCSNPDTVAIDRIFTEPILDQLALYKTGPIGDGRKIDLVDSPAISLRIQSSQPRARPDLGFGRGRGVPKMRHRYVDRDGPVAVVRKRLVPSLPRF